MVICYAQSCYGIVCPALVKFVLDQGNVGLIFTKGDVKEVRDEIAKHKVCI